MTANVPDLVDFFKAIANLSDSDTTIAILTGYHPDQLRVNMFDFIYHEHVSYFSCQDFINLGKMYGLSLVDVQRVGLKGGSLWAIFRKGNEPDGVSGDVGRLAHYEEWLNIRSINWFTEIHQRINLAKVETHKLLNESTASKVAGYGVSHSVTTLIHQFDLLDKIKVMTDDNPRRQGKFAPGSGLAVISPQSVVEQNFDAVIIMAWQHDGLIKKRLQEIGFAGSIVQPLPKASLSKMES